MGKKVNDAGLIGIIMFWRGIIMGELTVWFTLALALVYVIITVLGYMITGGAAIGDLLKKNRK